MTATARDAAPSAAREPAQAWQRALGASGVIAWEWDLTTDQVTTTAADGLWEREAGSLHEQLAHIHPDDRAAVLQARDDALSGAGSFRCEYRVLTRDGRVRWLESRGGVEPRPDGRTWMAGVAVDITERKHALEALQRSEQRLRESEARLRAIVEALPFDLWVCDRDGRYLLQNPSCRRAWGDRVGMLPEDTDTSPGLLSGWLEQNRRVLAGETVQVEESFEVGGELRHGQKVLAPIEIEGGVHGYVGVHVDVTDRWRTEAALRESEERLRLAVETTGLGTWDVDPPAGKRRWSAEFKKIVGLPEETEPDAELFSTLIHPEDREWVNALYRRAYEAEGGGHYEAEFRIRRASDGAVRWVLTTGRILFDIRGRPVRGIGTIQDVTDRQRSLAALRESEERYRALVETSPDAVYVHHRTRIILANRQAARLFGAANPDQLLGQSVFALVDESAIELARARTAGMNVPGARAELAELTYRRLDGSAFPVEAAAAAVLIDGEVAVQVVFREVSARQAAEQRQRLLLQELSHRVKNTLAVVQGIANQSVAGERTLAEAREAFLSRLQALASAHGLLTRGKWRGAGLMALATAELEPYGDRAQVTGEDVELAPGAVLTMGMVLHELATNAAKHGALSAPEGRVELSWSRADGALHLLWREEGGPPVGTPSRRGFGRQLIERAVAHDLRGQAEIDFAREGLSYRLRAPLAEIAAE